jgi:hypothetical protein
MCLVCEAIYGDAQTQSLAERVADNVSSEYAACAAYYQIVSVGLERASEAEGAANAYTASETAFQYSYLSAHESRSEEMARNVTRSRLEFYVKSMLEDIAHNMSNISILANNYADRCKLAIEDPEAFMSEVGMELLKGSEE